MDNLMEFVPSCDCNRLTNTGVYVQYGYVPKDIERPNIKCPVCGEPAVKEGK